jgi:preprotein translocase subunit SecB
MKPSPLQLKTYFLTELTVKAIPVDPAATTPPTPGTMSFSTKVHHAQNKTKPRDWRVGLRISCQPDGKGHGPYLVDMELLGFFEVAPSVKEELIKPLVMANAPALLYGAARELVLLVTGRAPYGPFMLPAATFVDEASAQKSSGIPGKSADPHMPATK